MNETLLRIFKQYVSLQTGPEKSRVLLDQAAFRNAISKEMLRTERSGNCLVLALVHFDCLQAKERDPRFGKSVCESIGSVLRATDTLGWYNQDDTIGLIFTDLRRPAADSIEHFDAKLQKALSLIDEPLPRPRVTYHLFPDVENSSGTGDPTFSPALVPARSSIPGILKRCIDVLGSLLMLLAFAPLLLIAAAAIKLTSPGPVCYRQTRIGHGGRSFVLLKFRSMFVNCDDSLHREYVTRMIAGANVAQVDQSGSIIYKLVHDPRITRVGRILRRTSLDELPQLFNVLMGHMSLVGPRPPLPYEFACYREWHKRRVLELKPGLTGLWQVYSRCRTSFEEMVRLDLKYARQWSLWLDVKILLSTPRAVLSRIGAY